MRTPAIKLTWHQWIRQLLGVPSGPSIEDRAARARAREQLEAAMERIQEEARKANHGSNH